MKKTLLMPAALILFCAAPVLLPAVEKSPTPLDVAETLRDTVVDADDRTVEKVSEVLFDLVTVHPDDEPALLSLHNRPIVKIRARFATDTPVDRVEGAVDRFTRATAGREIPEAEIRTTSRGTLFLIGSTTLFGISLKDLDPLGDQDLEKATAEIFGKIQQVLEEMREERSVRAILRAIGLSIVATLALILVLWLNTKLGRALLGRLAAGEKVMVKGVGGEMIPDTRKVTAFTRGLIGLTSWATGIFCFLIWLTFVLKRFPYTRPWGEEVYVFVHGTAMSVLLGFAKTLPNVFTIFLIIVIARILSRTVKALFEAAERGKTSLPWVFPETAMPTRRLLTAVIWVFAFVAIYPYLPGSGSEALRGLGVILGLMLSLGGSGVVSQAMSGMVLMYSRALRKGDYVRINETEGIVISLGMLATKIRTVKREEITIPNAVVLGTSTKNYTRLAGKEGVVLYTAVTIGYSEPWRKVHEALIAAALATEGLKNDPKPFVRQTALSDFYVEYQVNAYLEKPERRLLTLSKLHTNIQESFNEAGIVIVSPHYVNDPPHPAPEREPTDSGPV